MGWSFTWTFLAATFVTASTATVIYYTSSYLIRDHHRTVKKNEFKKRARTIHATLKTIQSEVVAIASQLRKLRQRDNDTDTKVKLQAKENLTVLLERLDSCQPKTLANEAPHLSLSCLELADLKRLLVQKCEKELDSLM